jgi:hypothetical protein
MSPRVYVAVAVVALLAPDPDWQVTAAGWLGMLVSLGTLVTLFWQRARKEGHDEARVKRQEERFTEFRRAVTSDVTTLRADMTADLNGMGKRVDNIEEKVDGMNVVVTGVLQTQATLMADGRHMAETTDRIERKLDSVLTRFFSPPSP